MPRRILMTGANGLLGKYLSAYLAAGGDEVVALRRGYQPDGTLHWDAGMSALDPAMVSGFDAVIHLSGEPVVGRWTQGKKQRIYDSRIRSTRALAAAIVGASLPPKVFLCASGVGFYGVRSETIVDEATVQGGGYLADVCRHWEEAARLAEKTSRVVSMRLGVVLSPRGGIVGSLLPLYRLGLGGPPGDGTQAVSWIALSDVGCAVDHLLSNGGLAGPVNLVSPQPVTAQELSDWIGEAVGKRALLRQPAWLIRAALGRSAAEETILSNLRVHPTRLLETGFRYCCPTLPVKLAELDALQPEGKG